MVVEHTSCTVYLNKFQLDNKFLSALILHIFFFTHLIQINDFCSNIEKRLSLLYLYFICFQHKIISMYVKCICLYALGESSLKHTANDACNRLNHQWCRWNHFRLLCSESIITAQNCSSSQFLVFHIRLFFFSFDVWENTFVKNTQQ